MTEDQIQTEIDAIKDQLIKKYNAKKIILFGSAAIGKITPDSDLDFLIIKNDQRNVHERLTTVHRLIKRNMAVDFIVYTPEEFSEKIKQKDPFVNSILLTGKVLYG